MSYQKGRSLTARATFVLAGALLLGALAALTGGSATTSDQEVVSIEWLGHQFFRFTSPQGVVVLTSPQLDNPDSPISLDQIDRADIILVPNSHPDDMGNPIEIAARTGATVLAPAPLGRWLVENGLDQRLNVRAGVGDTRDIQGVRIRALLNHHDNTLATGAWGGPAVSYMITFENGLTVYFSSHNPITMDMQLYGMLYQPHVLILSLGLPRQAPSPLEFAHTVRLLSTDNPNLRTVIPQHIRPGESVIAEAKTEMERLGFGELMFEPAVGVVYPLF